MKIPVIGLVCLMAAFSAEAQPFDFNRPGSEIQFEPREIQVPTRERFFNRIPGLPYRLIPLGPPDEPALNGGIGNGVVTPIREGSRLTGYRGSYFCSGLDEANAYRNFFPGLSAVESPNNVQNPENFGTYQFLGGFDECRQSPAAGEGVRCGEIPPDGRQYILGIPTHATDCHPWGRPDHYWHGGSVGETLYEQNPDTPRAPRDSFHQAYEGRNFIGGGRLVGPFQEEPEFLFSRYLVGMTQNPNWSDPESVRMGNNYTSGGVWIYWGEDRQVYDSTRASHPYVDIPWTYDHLRCGFTCSEIARTGLYEKKNPQFRTPPGTMTTANPTEMAIHQRLERERVRHYKDLLQIFTDSLGTDIAGGQYGDLDADTTDARGLRDILVTVWNIVREGNDRILGTGPGWRDWIDRTFGDGIDLHNATVPRGVIVSLDPEGRRIGLSSEVAYDCLSKRPYGSHAGYNLGEDRAGTPCNPSYGELREGGLYDGPQGQNYELYAQGDRLRGRVVRWPANGYSPVIASLISHALVHERALGKRRMEEWPLTPASMAEEELAILAQALTLWYLCRGNEYCPRSFPMRSEAFIRRYSAGSGGRVTEATAGRQFFYDSPRGYDGLFLGPLLTNLQFMGDSLREGDWERARFLANLHSQAPILQPPQRMTVNGHERDLVLPPPPSGGGGLLDVPGGFGR